MATKKTTKKKAKKTVIIKREVKPFDLTGGASQAETERQVVALHNLQATEGWVLLRQTLEMQVKMIDMQIIDKVDFDGKPITDTECDTLRRERAILQDLIDKPNQLLSQLERLDHETQSDDPYD